MWQVFPCYEAANSCTDVRSPCITSPFVCAFIGLFFFFLCDMQANQATAYVHSPASSWLFGKGTVMQSDVDPPLPHLPTDSEFQKKIINKVIITMILRNNNEAGRAKGGSCDCLFPPLPSQFIC